MELNLPEMLASRHDVLKSIRELELVEDTLTQESITAKPIPPSLSPALIALFQLNNLDIKKRTDRFALGNSLIELRDHAPVINISFAVEPSATVVQKIIAWFRQEIDSHALIHTGVQPSIAAGCVVRTTNMYFDFSLRQHLMRNSNLLLDELRSLV